MNGLSEQILSELRHVLGGMHDGGSVGASVYDTAQHLRFHPGSSGHEAAYAWLLAQQQADGGWGNPDFPLFRHVPTLAAMLALQHAGRLPDGRTKALRAARTFLVQQPDPYASAVPDDAPIGVELILPRLCRQAESVLPDLSFPRHAALYPLRQSRLTKLGAAQALPSGHPLLHSWEAWGMSPAGVHPDPTGSIGISPAATAAWRNRAIVQELGTHRAGPAGEYLRAASRATRTAIDGVVPNVWPIDVFEPCWSLYTLHLGGLFSHPSLADAVGTGVARIRDCMSARGVGPALHFAADADDTAVALCVLRLAGHEAAADSLRQFESGELFVTFPGERNASVSTNVHVLHALRLLDRPAPAARAYVEASRNRRGTWDNEKWHVSWLYPTAHAVAALAHAMPLWRDERVLTALLDAQHGNGGWGAGSATTFEETAYALFALRILHDREHAEGRRRIAQAVADALDWMLARYVPWSVPEVPLWIGKELYCPLRVVRVTELAGLWLAYHWRARAQSDARGEVP